MVRWRAASMDADGRRGIHRVAWLSGIRPAALNPAERWRGSNPLAPITELPVNRQIAGLLVAVLVAAWLPDAV